MFGLDDADMLLFTFRDRYRSEFVDFAATLSLRTFFAINEMPLFHNASLIYVWKR